MKHQNSKCIDQPKDMASKQTPDALTIPSPYGKGSKNGAQNPKHPLLWKAASKEADVH